MKILLAAYGCDPDSGSEARIGWNVATALADRGHEVWVLTSPRGVRPAANAFRVSDRHANLHVQFVSSGILERLLPSSRGWMLRYVLWQRAAFRAGQALAAGIDFDVVHHVSWGSLQGGSRLWRLGKPFVFGPVGGGQVAPPGFSQYFGRRWWAEATRSFIARHCLRFLPTARGPVRAADAVLAANHETLDAVRALGATYARHCTEIALPDSYFAATYPKRTSRETMTVVWVGRLLPRKALRLALEAMAYVPEELPIELLIVGGEELDPESHALATSPALADRVRHLGQVPFVEVRRVMTQSDVMLFTSLRDTNGSQILEAMGVGLPVVGLDHQGVRSFVSDSCGVRVPITSPTATARSLADALVALYEDPQHREELGRRAWEEARHHTWAATVEEYEHHYGQAIAGFASRSLRVAAG